MSKRNAFYAVAALIFLGAILRLVPHVANVTPITAIALFVSAYIGVRYSLLSVLSAMLASDAFIGFYSFPVMLSVYGSLAVAGLLGAYLQKNKTVKSALVITVSGSLVFFLVTNWAVWQFGTMYEHSFSGLMRSYMMAIPFFRNSLVGDLVYTGLFFGIYEVIRNRRHVSKLSLQL
jgi:hypothetical protein